MFPPPDRYVCRSGNSIKKIIQNFLYQNKRHEEKYIQIFMGDLRYLLNIICVQECTSIFFVKERKFVHFEYIFEDNSMLYLPFQKQGMRNLSLRKNQYVVHRKKPR